MRSLTLRPLAVFTIAFYVVSCILFTADSSTRLLSAVIFSFLLGLSVLFRSVLPVFRERGLKSAALSCLCFLFAGITLAGAVSYYTFDAGYKHITELYSTTHTIEGAVTEVVWDGGYSGIYTVKVKKAGKASDFFCTLTGNGGIPNNSTIKCTATFAPLEHGTDFDEKRYYMAKGVLLKADSENIEVTGDAGISLFSVSHKVNIYLSEIFYKYLGNEEGGFAAALMLGNKEMLSDTLNRDFIRLGISHVLAISGMHLTILCSFVNTLLRPLGKRAGQIGCLITVVFYMFITGLSPAITRSGIMVLVLIVSSFFRKKGDGYTNLGISVFLICIFDPFAAADVGLQLSFGAVMAILLYNGRRRELKAQKEETPKSFPKKLAAMLLSFLRSLFDDASLTVVVVLFLLPLEWLYFKSLSIVSPLTSPVFSVLTNFLIWTLPFLILLSPSPILSSLFSAPLKALIRLIAYIANRVSLLRGINLSLNYTFAPLFSVIVFLCILIFCITKKKKRILSALVTIAVISVFSLSCFLYLAPAFDRVDVHMVNYKNNDAMLLYSNNRAMVIDIGNGYSGTPLSALAKTTELQTTEIEVLMLTHLHNSYPVTLDKIFKRYVVRKLMVPECDSDRWLLAEIAEVSQSNNVEVETYTPGDTVSFEDASIKTFPYEYIKRSVQPVISLEISAFDESLVYLGGAFSESSPDASFPDADIIWFGDHGPLYKNKFSFKASPDALLYADSDAAEYISSDSFILVDTSEKVTLGQ